MRRLSFVVAVAVCAMWIGLSGDSFAQGRHHHSPPVVLGPTGQPYGPTQAEYQYRLRYGHPSPNSHPGDMDYVNGYPGGRSSVHIHGVPPVPTYGAYPGSGVVYGGYQYQSTSVYGPGLFVGQVVPGGPVIVPPGGVVYPPAIIGGNPAGTLNTAPIPRGGPNDPLNDPNFTNPGAGAAFATPPYSEPIVEPSTPAQQIRSIRHTDAGDKQLAHIHYATAAAIYKQAIAAARDQATPRFRLAIAYAGMSRFREAIQQYKVGLALDPTWPQHSEQLVDLLGDGNTMARNLLIHRVAEWVNEDIRDPERLFLLTAILHQNGDGRSQTILQTALLLGGDQPHLTVFLPQANGAPTQPVIPAANVTDNVIPQEAAPVPAPSGPPPIPMPPTDPPPPSFSPDQLETAAPVGEFQGGPLLPQR
ncbi:MAG: hypothetical protein R3C18_07635 [Planctomycetaceae bacterium]